MSTEIALAPVQHRYPQPVFEPAEQFPYGWRYIQHVASDGAVKVEQQPLTIEDVLHPEEHDQVTHSDAHQRRRRYLCNVLEAQVAHDPQTLVLDDVRIKWDTPALKPHGPDIMVIRGVRERKNWSTFDVAVEGVRPLLIIEITSPETRALDLTFKLEEYDLAGVPLYIIVDSVQRRGRDIVRLLGYRQSASAYDVWPPDSNGRLVLNELGLSLAVEDDELVCYNAAGQKLYDYAALDTARVTAEQRAAAAEAQIRALQAELHALRGEAQAPE